MSGTAVMENPMLASSASVSISASVPAPSPRNAPTVPSLGRLVGQYTNNVPYPLLFVAGAALGILVASLVVLFSHSTKPRAAMEPTITAVAVAAPAATWQPNVVIIRPAPVDPPMFDTPYVAEPAALAPPQAAAPARATTTTASTKKTVARAQVRHQSKPASGNLLNAAL